MIKSINFSMPAALALIAASFSCAVEREAGPPDLRRAPNLHGADAQSRVDQLPYLSKGVRALQFSSHDRSGGNNDGFTGEYSYLYRENDSYVIFDSDGPGCITRMWFTGIFPVSGFIPLPDVGKISFYFDGDPGPAISRHIRDLFAGTSYPFIFPLSGFDEVSSGGCYTYVPICFSGHLKIATENLPTFVQIDSAIYSRDYDIKSTLHPVAAGLRQWQRAGEDPKNWADNKTVSYGSAGLSAGESAGAISISGPGAVSAIRVKVSQDEEVLRGLYLKITWDDMSSPAVSSPVGDFFGSALAGADYKSLFTGISESGNMYSYFPMPFRSGMRLEFENRSGRETGPLSAVVEYQKEGYDADAGYFHARFNEENPNLPGRGYTVLEASGSGKFVGNTITFRALEDGLAQCKNAFNEKTGLCYLEGDELIYTDSRKSPDFYGTGTEDIYNGGWYFENGIFALPVHGVPVFDNVNPRGLSAYRYRIGDASEYSDGIRFLQEVGPNDEIRAHYRSTAFYYGRDEAGIVKSDLVDVGDAVSETEHSYKLMGGSVATAGSYSFEGLNSAEVITDEGRVPDEGSGSSFKVKLDPGNAGARLRVRVDQGTGKLAAEVRFDGVFAGRFYSAYVNEFMRWGELDIDIPASLCAGKTGGTVEVRRVKGFEWNEFRYDVFSIK